MFPYEHKYILLYIISFIILVHNFMSSLVRNYFDPATTALLLDRFGLFERLGNV